MITIVAPSRYKLNKKLVKNHAEEYLHGYGNATSLVNIIFVGKRKMTEIAATYKNERVALPVLSFPYKNHNEDNLKGEIFVCYPQTILLAAERHKKVDETIIHLIEHGIDNLFK